MEQVMECWRKEVCLLDYKTKTGRFIQIEEQGVFILLKRAKKHKQGGMKDGNKAGDRGN